MTETATGPMAGTRVLDLTRILAGPLCTMMLGDMGAEIIKVEPPGTGDDTRGWGPPFAAGEAAYFLGVNRNKRSITLNMAAPAGQKVLADLIAKADVLVDNFKIGTLAKWGFTDAWFDKNAPRLVRCSITGYGSQRTEGVAARLRLHPAGRVRPDEHLRRGGQRPDQVRRRDRRRLHRHAGLQLDPRRAQRAAPHRQGPEGRGLALQVFAGDAGQRRVERAGVRQGRRPVRQRPSRASCPTPPIRPPTR